MAFEVDNIQVEESTLSDDGNEDNENQQVIPSEIQTLLDYEIRKSPETVPHAVNYDEVPIKTKGKTFEEVLEDELKKTSHKESSNTSAQKQTAASTPKRTFLRKGQGISRFNGPPLKPKKPNKTKSTAKLHSNDGELERFESQVIANNIDHNQGTEMWQKEINQQYDKESSLTAELTKPCVRKTSRLVSRKEPITTLILKPPSSPPKTSPIRSVNKLSLSDDSNIVKQSTANVSLVSDNNSDDDGGDDEGQYSPGFAQVNGINTTYRDTDQDDEECWSDGGDVTLGLDATLLNLPSTIPENIDQTETFEQIEKYFCDSREKADSPEVRSFTPPLPSPPPNALMQKLFPAIKPAIEKPNKMVKKEIPSQHIEGNKPEIPFRPAQYVDREAEKQATILKNKLEELQAEIKKFQDETAKLQKSRLGHEENMKKLQAEQEAFEQQKLEKTNEFEEYKKKEISKLKKERKLFEEHAAAAAALPNKQVRYMLHLVMA